MKLLPNPATDPIENTRRTALVSSCILGLLALILSVSPSLMGQGGTVRVEGTIHTDAGELPNSGVTVRIETEDGELAAQGTATSSGGFTFEAVVKRICRLIIKAEGFETSEQTIDLTRTGNTFMISVNLVPARKSPVPTLLPALSDAGASRTAKREYEKGDAALKAQKLGEARNHFEKAVAEYPCYARAQTDLALVLGELHEMAQAEAAAQKARSCDPDFLEAYIQLGMILNNEKKFTEGEAMLQEGIRRAPLQWQFYYELATAHFGEGKFTQAEDDYQRVLSLNSSPPSELRVKLADVYLKEKSYEKAYAQMEEYLKAEPNGRFAAKVKTIMQQMEAAGVIAKNKS